EAALMRDDARRVTHHHRARRHRAGHDRAGKDVGVVADRHLADDQRAGADEHAITERRHAALGAAPRDTEGHVLLDSAVGANLAARQYDGAEGWKIKPAADLGVARQANAG